MLSILFYLKVITGVTKLSWYVPICYIVSLRGDKLHKMLFCLLYKDAEPALPVFAKLNILRINETAKLETGKFMHSAIKSCEKKRFNNQNEMLKFIANSHKTRHATRLNHLAYHVNVLS